MLSSDVFSLDPDDFEREAWRLRRLARGLLLDGHASEDVVQEAWLAALSRREAGGKGALGAWLAGTVRNLALERRRRAARALRREREVARDEAVEGGDAIVERIEMTKRLVTALEALPDHYRSVVTLRYLEGLSPREIAARLGLPMSTVHTRIGRGLALLRRALDPGSDAERERMLGALAPLAMVPQFEWPWSRPGVTPLPNALPLTGTLTMWKKSLATGVALVLVLATPFVLRALSQGASGSGVEADDVALERPTATRPSTDSTGIENPQVAGRLRVPALSDDSWTVRGRLIDDAGRPLPDTPLELGAFAGYDDQAPAWTSGRIRSDARGQFQWPIPPPDGPLHLMATDVPKHRVLSFGRTVLTRESPTETFEVRARPLDVEVVGTVVDDRGTPLVGATVTSYGGDARTDERGAFVALSSGSLPVHSLRVFVDGFDVTRASVASNSVDRVDAGVIRLSLGRVLCGRVVDGGGRPVANAEVTSDVLVETGRVDGPRTRTDGEGRFSLGGYARDADWPRVIVAADGFARFHRYLEAPDFASEIEISLAAGAVVEGRILDEDGQPLEGATVEVGGAPGFVVNRKTWSDANGAYRIADCPPGTQTVWARRRGLEAASATAGLTGGEVATLDLTLGPGEELGGVVVDDRGVPVPSARVSVSRSTGSPDYSPGGGQRTDEQGRFHFTGLAAGSFEASVVADGFARTTLPAVETGRLDHELLIARRGRIAGRVLDAGTGEPLDEFTVQFVEGEVHGRERRLTGYHTYWDDGVTFRAADGVFDCDRDAFDADRVIGVRVSAPGYGPVTAPRVFTGSDAEAVPVEFRLWPGRRVSGRVIDATTEAPLADVRVLLLDDPADAAERTWKGTTSRSVEPDANGEFVFDDVAPGPCWLMATHAERAPTLEGPIDVAHGSDPSPRQLVLGPGTALEILVEIEDDPNLEQIVELTALDVAARTWKRRTESTDRTGRAVFEHLAPGRYGIRSLAVFRGDGRSHRVPLLNAELDVVGATQESFRLAPRGDASLTGVLLAPDGLDLAGVDFLYLFPLGPDEAPDASRSLRGARVQDGAFVLRGIEGGLYAVSVGSLNGVNRNPTVEPERLEIEAGGFTSVELEVR